MSAPKLEHRDTDDCWDAPAMLCHHFWIVHRKMYCDSGEEQRGRANAFAECFVCDLDVDDDAKDMAWKQCNLDLEDGTDEDVGDVDDEVWKRRRMSIVASMCRFREDGRRDGIAAALRRDKQCIVVFHAEIGKTLVVNARDFGNTDQVMFESLLRQPFSGACHAFADGGHTTQLLVDGAVRSSQGYHGREHVYLVRGRSRWKSGFDDLLAEIKAIDFI